MLQAPVARLKAGSTRALVRIPVTTGVYTRPAYYDAAFSYIEPVAQVNVFRNFISAFSKRGVNSVLDVCCGPGDVLCEFAAQGYGCVGLDLSRQMVSYALKKASEKGVRIKAVVADMRCFELEEPVDFAFIMNGSINYVLDQEGLRSHLRSVSSSLKAGGLYLIENAHMAWPRGLRRTGKTPTQTWTGSLGRIKTRAFYRLELQDNHSSEVIEHLDIHVKEGKRRRVFKEETRMRLILRRQLEDLVAHDGSFELVGWFKRAEPLPLLRPRRDNMLVLRKIDPEASRLEPPCFRVLVSTHIV
jgi:SAM-dependent methyltransferase